MPVEIQHKKIWNTVDSRYFKLPNIPLNIRSIVLMSGRVASRPFFLIVQFSTVLEHV